jgi:hypothetical protein
MRVCRFWNVNQVVVKGIIALGNLKNAGVARKQLQHKQAVTHAAVCEQPEKASLGVVRNF